MNDAATLVTLFGILRSGRVAVPIDPREAPERAARIVGLTTPSLFVRAAPAPTNAPDLGWRPVTDLHPGPVPPLAGIRPVDPALVIFTSGSTGRPKGVVRTQHMLTAVDGNLPPDDATARFAFTYPLAFLGAVVCALAIVHVRATACFLDAAAVGIDRLVETFREQRITYCSGTPSLLRAVAERAVARGDVLPGVTLIWIGGEPTTAADLQLLRRVWPEAVIHNYYGTQESGAVTGWPLRPGDPLPDGAMPAGTPVHGFGVAVVDDDGEPVPVGSVGRIGAFGPITTTDYLGDPEAAAAMRVTVDGQVGMCTGDLGYLDPDGTLHVVGRTDQRIKVFGAGVDILEVEAALRAVPGITDAAISAVPDDRAGHRLVAHVVTDGTAAAPTVAGLRTALADRLPTAMHPRRVLAYDALPRTARAKTDRIVLDLLAADPEPPLRSGPDGLTALGPHRTDRATVLLVVARGTPLGPLLACAAGTTAPDADVWALARPRLRPGRRVRRAVAHLPRSGARAVVVVEVPDGADPVAVGPLISERLRPPAAV